MATQAAPRQTMPGSTKPPTRKLSLAEITTAGSKLPGRYLVYGPEGSGKTSFGAMTPNPIFVQTKGETGLDTLIDANRLGKVPHFPGDLQTWEELRSAVDALMNEEHKHKCLVIDTINGAEKLCHKFTCDQHFNGIWDDKGFQGYMRGYDVALPYWTEFLADLDRLRETRTMSIMGLCHSKIAPFKNPEGPDYDRYSPDMHHKTWSLTHKWADAVLFLNFETFTEKDGLRNKGKGGQRRVMYCERHAAFDAKNRFGLPEEIDLGDSPQEAWSAFSAALKEGRTQNQTEVK